MKQFLLIFRHENMSGKVSPEQMQIWMHQQTEWIGSIQAQGKYVSGTGLLFDNAKVVNHEKKVNDGPYGLGKQTIGGFIIVKAETSIEASEFAKGAPILLGDGNTVEIREVFQQ